LRGRPRPARRARLRSARVGGDAEPGSAAASGCGCCRSNARPNWSPAPRSPPASPRASRPPSSWPPQAHRQRLCQASPQPPPHPSSRSRPPSDRPRLLLEASLRACPEKRRPLRRSYRQPRPSCRPVPATTLPRNRRTRLASPWLLRQADAADGDSPERALHPLQPRPPPRPWRYHRPARLPSSPPRLPSSPPPPRRGRPRNPSPAKRRDAGGGVVLPARCRLRKPHLANRCRPRKQRPPGRRDVAAARPPPIYPRESHPVRSIQLEALPQRSQSPRRRVLPHQALRRRSRQ
jgi:hypothetical protein